MSLRDRVSGMLQGRRSDGTPVARVWLDVGAHLGEKTLSTAIEDPSLRLYAFEPNLRIAVRLMEASPPNVIVVPAAVGIEAGVALLNVTESDPASSLLDYNEAGRAGWKGDGLDVVRRVTVPVLRLDEFLEAVDLRELNVPRIEFLKIDAQGGDLDVVRSLGSYLEIVQKIELEVQTTDEPLYLGASTLADVRTFMETSGFTETARESQTFGQELNLTFERSA